MPDFDKLDQCVALAKVLWFLPAPARSKVAEGLFDVGVRFHPELATKTVMVTGPAGLGGHRPRQLVKMESRRDAENIIKNFLPDLHDKLQAATTEQQKQQILREIRERHPEVIAKAEQQLAAVDLE